MPRYTSNLLDFYTLNLTGWWIMIAERINSKHCNYAYAPICMCLTAYSCRKLLQIFRKMQMNEKFVFFFGKSWKIFSKFDGISIFDSIFMMNVSDTDSFTLIFRRPFMWFQYFCKSREISWLISYHTFVTSLPWLIYSYAYFKIVAIFAMVLRIAD